MRGMSLVTCQTARYPAGCPAALPRKATAFNNENLCIHWTMRVCCLAATTKKLLTAAHNSAGGGLAHYIILILCQGTTRKKIYEPSYCVAVVVAHKIAVCRSPSLAQRSCYYVALAAAQPPPHSLFSPITSINRGNQKTLLMGLISPSVFQRRQLAVTCGVHRVPRMHPCGHGDPDPPHFQSSSFCFTFPCATIQSPQAVGAHNAVTTRECHGGGRFAG